MKPILYEANTTMFTGTGLGMLSDCISCEVTEERNGIYECEFRYPITGIHYSEIVQGRIIRVSHDEQKDLQSFTIYERSAEISGIVTFYAHHISYELNSVVVRPYKSYSLVSALYGFTTYAMTRQPFVFWTDKTNTGVFSVTVPSSVRSLLGGTEGSILDVYGGGEYEFDNHTVKLHQSRGSDNGVTIRYGKNLTDIEQNIDASSLYNSVVPYWSDGTNTVVYGGVVTGDGGIKQTMTWTDENGLPMQDENGSVFTFTTAMSKVVPMDLSGEFEEMPTVAQLESRALSILNNNEPWIPKENIEIDFVALWQTEEYKNIAPLERVKLCDTVHVQYTDLGVDATAKVIRVVWDVLTERYVKIELGDTRTSFADVLMAETAMLMKDYPDTSMMQEAIDHATEQITGGLGGNIVFTLNGDGNPIEQLIMDTDDKETAVNVWRWNLGGLGHSHNGYNGPFNDVAITQDGRINASMITTGYMRANRIQGGELTLGGADNGNGVFRLLDEANNLVGTWDNSGMSVTGEMDFAGWKLDSETLGKSSDVESGVASTWYRVFLNAPSTITGNDMALCAYEAPYDGSTFGNITTNFVLRYDGSIEATKATLSGTFRNQMGSEWIGIDESVISGGYGNATHGTLDLSSQYNDGTYKVVLENKVSDIIFKVPQDKRIYMQYGTQTPTPMIVGMKSLSGDEYIQELRLNPSDPYYSGNPSLVITTLSGMQYTAELHA